MTTSNTTTKRGVKRIAKGRRLEHRSRKLLESAGYTVIRSAGSKGPFDLIGISATELVAVQVKAGSWPSGLEIEAMERLPVPMNCRKLVHRWRPNMRQPDVKELTRWVMVEGKTYGDGDCISKIFQWNARQ